MPVTRRAAANGVEPPAVSPLPNSLQPNLRPKWHAAADSGLHLYGAFIFILVFVWHFSPEAARMPGAKSFGWFFRFLTFWGWTLQTLQFTAAALFSVTSPKQRHWRQLARFVDDISCVAFCFATTVTVQFWSLHWATGGLVEKASDRPWWLGVTVHAVNAVFAWLDIIIGRPRTFSPRARQYTGAVAIAYGCWMAFCRFINKTFPYPFMNVVPAHPAFVFIGLTIVSFIVVAVIFEGGRQLARGAHRSLQKETLDEWEARVRSEYKKRSNGAVDMGRA